MKKMKLTRSLLAACSIVALSAVMYGCVHGDGGDDSMQTSEEDMMPEPMPTPDEQIAALQEQINTLRAALGLDPIDIAQLTGSVADLRGQVADLTQQIADRDKAIADAAAMAMTAKGKAIFGVLDPLGNATDAAQSAIAAAAPAVTASYGKATAVTTAAHLAFVDQESVDTATGATAEPAFTSAQAGMPAMLAANNGFSGTMLTWADTGRADTMIVYTDVGAPRGGLFAEEEGDAGAQTKALGTTPHGGVTGTAFDGRTGGEVTHERNSEPDADGNPTVVRLSGAYKGAAGSYSCTGADCTSSRNANGTFTFGGGGGWTFTANTGAMVSVADGAYMLFGWWMRDDLNTAGPLDSVAVFHGAQGGTPITAGVDAYTGTAKYEGGAAGKYAWRDRVADTAHGGHFTAKAELTANFDGTAGTGGTMSGSLSDFQIGDDGMDPNWSVALSAAGISDAGAVARVATVMTQWAVGESKADMAGGWEAQLSNTGAERNDNLPTGVSGAFNAEFGEQGRMLGAFGANITNPNPPN